MQKLALNLSFLILVALLGGCAPSIGHEFDATYIDKIVRGKTTKAEIRQNMGEPMSITITDAGSERGESWMYQHVQGKGLIGQYVSYFKGENVFSGDSISCMISFKGDKVENYSCSKGRR